MRERERGRGRGRGRGREKGEAQAQAQAQAEAEAEAEAAGEADTESVRVSRGRVRRSDVSNERNRADERVAGGAGWRLRGGRRVVVWQLLWIRQIRPARRSYG